MRVILEKCRLIVRVHLEKKIIPVSGWGQARMLRRPRGEKSQHLQHNTVEKQTSALWASIHIANSNFYREQKPECLTLKPTDIPPYIFVGISIIWYL